MIDLAGPLPLRLAAAVVLALSALPTLLFLINLPLYRRLPKCPKLPRNPTLSACVPCPKVVGLPQTQPRATPWDTPTQEPHFALRGHPLATDRLSHPFRADATTHTPFRGPYPRLCLFRPFGRPSSWSNLTIRESWKFPTNPNAAPPSPLVSVLIPARNETEAIVPALQSVLSNPDPHLEVLVLDDHSTDETATRVQAIAESDPRVKLLSGDKLPPGWCGKQHACWQLAQASRGDLLVFMDADVQLSADALARVQAHFERKPNTHLLSGVPRQMTLGFAEKLLIPLIHFILLGFLPMLAARLSRWPAFAAGCGQFFVARRPAYFESDGHRAIRGSLHDGIQLPRQFRRHHLQTEIFDATDIAACRMYTSGSAVWRGLGKNATEGLAQPAAILPWTLVLFGGQVLPWLLLFGTPWLTPLQDDRVFHLSLVAAGLSLLPRWLGALAFSQSWLGALLHPVGISALLAIQWQALARRWRGQPMEWRGRRYPHAANVAANPPSTA